MVEKRETADEKNSMSPILPYPISSSSESMGTRGSINVKAIPKKIKILNRIAIFILLTDTS
jgi:hypothetical protein